MESLRHLKGTNQIGSNIKLQRDFSTLITQISNYKSQGKHKLHKTFIIY